MNRETLENICKEVNKEIEESEVIVAEEILERTHVDDSDFRKQYLTFVKEYVSLKQDYGKEIESRTKLKIKPERVSLSRIAWNSFMGALLGSGYNLTAGAATGFAITTYDEIVNKRKMDLSYTFWGTFVGGLIGWIFDGSNSHVGTFGTYTGAAIGGGMGFLREFFVSTSDLLGRVSIDTKEKRKIDRKYNGQRKELIQETLEGIRQEAKPDKSEKPGKPYAPETPSKFPKNPPISNPVSPVKKKSIFENPTP